MVTSDSAGSIRGKRRFSEFQKSLGVARNILAARLKKLVRHGVFDLVPASDGRVFHEYALTDRGRGLYVVLMALRQWGESCLYGHDGPKYRFVDVQKGEPVRPLELRARDGRLLTPEDIKIVAISEIARLPAELVRKANVAACVVGVAFLNYTGGKTLRHVVVDISTII